MKKLLQSELFVVANLISFVALFCAIFIIAMSDNYNPTAIGTMLPMRIMMWMMLFNIVCLLCSIGSLELENRK
jgi:hypothetical protein